MELKYFMTNSVLNKIVKTQQQQNKKAIIKNHARAGN